MSDLRPPLNGVKTHPLTDFAWGILTSVSWAPRPYSEINAGVIDRLTHENLVEIVDLPSPFKTHKGKLIRFIRITEDGRRRLSSGER